MRLCMCVHARARARVRACLRECARLRGCGRRGRLVRVRGRGRERGAGVRARVRACVCVCVCKSLMTKRPLIFFPFFIHFKLQGGQWPTQTPIANEATFELGGYPG